MNTNKRTGKFVHVFPRFADGFATLCMVSMSAHQAVGKIDPEGDVERQVIANLALNAALDRPTGNGVDWGRCSINIRADGVDYMTSGGLSFGWRVYSSNYQHYREDRVSGASNSWEFYIVHPAGLDIPDDSTLAESAKQWGWREVLPTIETIFVVDKISDDMLNAHQVSRVVITVNAANKLLSENRAVVIAKSLPSGLEAVNDPSLAHMSEIPSLSLGHILLVRAKDCVLFQIAHR